MKITGGKIAGILLIVFGIILFLNNFLGLHIPVLGVLFGLFIILVGLGIIFSGSRGFGDDRNLVFDAERTIEANAQGNEYNIIFSKGTVDLSGIQADCGGRKLNVNAIFAHGTLIIDPDIPVSIKASSAFGAVELPDHRNISFNTAVYRTGEPAPGCGYLEIEATAVFGYLQIIEKRF